MSRTEIGLYVLYCSEGFDCGCVTLREHEGYAGGGRLNRILCKRSIDRVCQKNNKYTQKKKKKNLAKSCYSILGWYMRPAS